MHPLHVVARHPPLGVRHHHRRLLPRSRSRSKKSSRARTPTRSRSPVRSKTTPPPPRARTPPRVIVQRMMDDQPFQLKSPIDDNLRWLQLAQEGRVYLQVGGQRFETSKLTLAAVPDTVLASMIELNCPFRPNSSGNAYFIDRDGAHFRFILNYLRNGGNLDIRTLPRDRRYLAELIGECDFYHLKGLKDLCQKRMRQVVGMDYLDE